MSVFCSKMRFGCICGNLVLTCHSSMQERAIEPQRYYELMEKDTIKFGNSR